MSLIETSIVIDAPVEDVWKVLLDFESYKDWNPFIRRAEVDLKVGGEIDFDEHRPNSPKATYRSIIKYLDFQKKFGWSGGIKHIWDVEHIFLVESMPNGKTKFMQNEISKGVLVPFIKGKIAATKEGFELMNQAIKERCEILVAANMQEDLREAS